MTYQAIEFFAGIGLARMGLERAGISTVWANDIEPSKAEMYEAHFGPGAVDQRSVAEVRGGDVPDADVAWASFPCTDLSVAGAQAGLGGKQSSTFFEFTRVLGEMGERRPRVVAVENVTALASSRGGRDLEAVLQELEGLGYETTTLTLDARRFVPQSRPRLFIVGALGGVPAGRPSPPPLLEDGLGGMVDDIPLDDPRWWPADRYHAFMRSVPIRHLARLMEASRDGGNHYRTAYRRTRNGAPVWEIRPDAIAGCLRTPRGGSSRQAVVRVTDRRVHVRWMTPHEYARLMGAAEYTLGPDLTDRQIMFGFGDAVCVDVVEWVAENYLLPALDQ